MARLRDGTVLPSFLGVQDRASHTAGAAMTMSDGVLRVGEVIARYRPSAAENVSKNENEYIVLVNRRDATGTTVQTRYRCVLKDGFGSQGDHSRQSLRARSASQAKKVVGNGAIVLIACINADQAQAVILDCLRHPQRQQKDPEGEFYSFEFNGVSVEVQDDGAFTLTVPGATDTDGNPRGTRNKGSKLKFEAGGDITLTDEDGQSVKLSPSQKTIEVKAGEGKETAEERWTIKAPKVVVEADEISLGSDSLNYLLHSVVIGKGIDTLTGLPYSILGNTSKSVFAKE